MREWLTENAEQESERTSWRLHAEAWAIGIMIVLPIATAILAGI